MLKAFVFKMKSLFYSYKSPIAYQVKTSNLLVPPSALLGAIYKNYVRFTGLDYGVESLKNFLSAVKYVGLTVLPRDRDAPSITIKKFDVLIKHHRVEADRGLRADAMIREFVYSSSEFVGVVVIDEAIDVNTMIKSVESIEYIGNSESLVSVQIVEVTSPSPSSDKGMMLQMVSKNIDLLPKIGVIEQCGKIPPLPWGGRSSEDVCYVWEPLEPVGRDLYRVLSYEDVKPFLKVQRIMSVHSKKLGITLVFTYEGFDCLKPHIDIRSVHSSTSQRRRRKGGKR